MLLVKNVDCHFSISDWNDKAFRDSNQPVNCKHFMESNQIVHSIIFCSVNNIENKIGVKSAGNVKNKIYRNVPITFNDFLQILALRFMVVCYDFFSIV